MIDHRSLSRRHAVLRPGRPGQRAAVQDLDSTNGTRVAGVVRKGGEPVELAANDSFHIGPFSFVVVARVPGEDRSVSGRDVLRVIDPSPRHVPALVRDIAATKASVLILGETGVGKEVLADHAARAVGPRRRFTRINCAALSESLLESELFGHEKGAFTGAATQQARPARVGRRRHRVPRRDRRDAAAMQAKLLRVVEDREVLRLGRDPPRRRSTSASSPPPTAICPPRSPPATSAAICSSASTA